jgi:hypothetical protein
VRELPSDFFRSTIHHLLNNSCIPSLDDLDNPHLCLYRASATMSSPIADDDRNIGSISDPFLLPDSHQRHQTPSIPPPSRSQDATQQGAEPSSESLGYVAATQQVREVDGHPGSATRPFGSRARLSETRSYTEECRVRSDARSLMFQLSKAWYLHLRPTVRQPSILA